MFIACAKSDRAAYLKVCQSYGVRENGKVKIKVRVIKNLGPLSRFDDGKGDYLKRLRQSFREGKPLIEQLNDLASLNPTKGIIKLQFDKSKSESWSKPQNIGYFLLESWYEALGISHVLTKHKCQGKITYDLDGIVKLLVFGRTFTPSSKLATFLNRDSYLFSQTKTNKLNQIYKSLSVLNTLADKIQKRINTKITPLVGGRDEVVFYDVTNFFFTINQNDSDLVDQQTGQIISKGLRKKGVSKEKRQSPIVQMGLFIDKWGIPIAYKLFPGNQTDQMTLRPALQKSIGSLNFGKVIVVADGGLNSGPNIAHILKVGNGYVVSKSTAKSDKQVKQWILDQSGYRYNHTRSFKSKSIIRERIILDQDKKPVKIKEKLICFWSQKHYLKELKENQSFIQYLNTVILNPDKLKDKQPKIAKFLKKQTLLKETGQVVKTTTHYTINQDKVQQYLDLLGYYTLMTSEVDKPDEQIISLYHGLAKIEDSFRLLKSDLTGRPVYVSTPEHINAHFLICFIALTIIRLIQHYILTYLGKPTAAHDNWEQGLSANKIKKALFNFQADSLSNGYYRLTPITSDLKLILDSHSINAELPLPTISQLHQLRSNFKRQINELKSVSLNSTKNTTI